MTTTDNRLIPCNERMPEHNERYEDRTRKHYLILDEYGGFHVAYYTSIGWIPTDGFHITDDEVEVIAWMPLPEKSEPLLCKGDELKTIGRISEAL